MLALDRSASVNKEMKEYTWVVGQDVNEETTSAKGCRISQVKACRVVELVKPNWKSDN